MLCDCSLFNSLLVTLVVAFNLLLFDEACSLISSLMLGLIKDACLFFYSPLVACCDIAFSLVANLIYFEIITKKILFCKKNFDTCILVIYIFMSAYIYN